MTLYCFYPGKELNKNTVGEFFQTAGIQHHDLYRVCGKLGLKQPAANRTEGENRNTGRSLYGNKHDAYDKGNAKTKVCNWYQGCIAL